MKAPDDQTVFLSAGAYGSHQPEADLSEGRALRPWRGAVGGNLAGGKSDVKDSGAPGGNHLVFRTTVLLRVLRHRALRRFHLQIRGTRIVFPLSRAPPVNVRIIAV